MKVDILCPICNKVIAKKEQDGSINKAYLWCRRCRKEIFLNDKVDKIEPESNK